MARRWAVDPPFWSALLGVVEAFGGGLLAGRRLPARACAASSIEGSTPRSPPGFEEHPGERAGGVWSGSFAWLRWLTSPLTLLLVLTAVTGAVRLMSFAVGREAVGEPLLWVGWRLWRGVRKSALAADRTVRFGSARPDRVLPTDDGGLLVLTSEPRPEWNELVTIGVGERFFRLAEVGERREAGAGSGTATACARRTHGGHPRAAALRATGPGRVRTRNDPAEPPYALLGATAFGTLTLSFSVRPDTTSMTMPSERPVLISRRSNFCGAVSTST